MYVMDSSHTSYFLSIVYSVIEASHEYGTVQFRYVWIATNFMYEILYPCQTYVLISQHAFSNYGLDPKIRALICIVYIGV